MSSIDRAYLAYMWFKRWIAMHWTWICTYTHEFAKGKIRLCSTIMFLSKCRCHSVFYSLLIYTIQTMWSSSFSFLTVLNTRHSTVWSISAFYLFSLRYHLYSKTVSTEFSRIIFNLHNVREEKVVADCPFSILLGSHINLHMYTYRYWYEHAASILLFPGSAYADVNLHIWKS